ncbi:hypothetical protein GGI07_003524 [Coemansia sp. Benny D115]|nr:hypothetical protein GGI07_003524 [Coemansia sp. Benny D115]
MIFSTGIAVLALVASLVSEGALAHGALDRRDGRKCNGYSDLCDRKFNRVAYAATHNSFAVGDSLAANQNMDIATQLNKGVRALMLDLHDPSKTGLSFGKRSVVPTLCHTSCVLLNAGPAVDQLKVLREFMDANVDEVLTVFLENAEDFDSTVVSQLFTDAGLSKYLFTPNGSGDDYVWPTLRQMIANDSRLVVLNSLKRDSKSPDWLLYDRDYAVQTPWSVKAGSQFSCSLLTEKRPLTVMNHFVVVDYPVLGTSVEIPDYNSTLLINTRASIIDQANLCGSAGLFPNFVAVDFFDAGAVLQAVADLNKVNFVAPTAVKGNNDAKDAESSSSVSSSASAAGLPSMRSGAMLLLGLVGVLAAAM